MNVMFVSFAMCCLVPLGACLVCWTVCLGVFPLPICHNANPKHIYHIFLMFNKSYVYDMYRYCNYFNVHVLH